MLVCPWVCVYKHMDIYISVFFLDLSILMFFSLFTLFSHFRFDLRNHYENTAFLSVFCIVDVIRICL